MPGPSTRATTAALLLTLAACGGGGTHVSARSAPTVPGTTAATTTTVPATTTTRPRRTATTTAKVVRTAITSGTLAPAPATSVATTPPTTVPVCVPVPYDPAAPINLCGTPGVTPAEEMRADALVVGTIRDLPRYATTQAAYNDGYRTIGDSDTGYEHYVKWSLVNDRDVLDTTHPESLVYKLNGAKRTLVAAMYMLWEGARFTDIPDVGGPLMQWHVHNDLCFQTSPSDALQLLVAGKTDAQGHCPAGQSKAGNVPMVHVWVVKNSCGPFASLTGEGGGQLAPGETRWCDNLHGSR